MTLEQQIAVMQAFKEGKEIEIYLNNNTWGKTISPSWDWMNNTYRVKPDLTKGKLHHHIKSSQENVLIQVIEHYVFLDKVYTVTHIETKLIDSTTRKELP